MTSWLHRQRKTTILDLSREAGLKADEDTRKDDLIDALDRHLQQNQSQLSRNSAFENYYGTRRTPFTSRTSAAHSGPTASTAGGATSDSGEVKSVVKARGKRTTQVKDEQDESSGAASAFRTVAAALAERTPAPLRRRSQLLPASPADVAEDMENAAHRFSTNLERYYHRSGVPKRVEDLRQACSSAVTVHAAIIMLEAWSLSQHVMPFKYAFDIPGVKLTSSDATPRLSVKLPDLFMLLTGFFWKTTFVWALTNLLLPLAAAYFFNLSTKHVKRNGTRVAVWRHVYDPLSFNIAKALLTYIVYSRHVHAFGLISAQTAHHVNHAMLGGEFGVLVGCAIGALVSLYEAAQM